jgi:hypothetical protein
MVVLGGEMFLMSEVHVPLYPGIGPLGPLGYE